VAAAVAGERAGAAVEAAGVEADVAAGVVVEEDPEASPGTLEEVGSSKKEK